MTQKTFIPFYEVKNHVGDVLVVDEINIGFETSRQLCNRAAKKAIGGACGFSRCLK